MPDIKEAVDIALKSGFTHVGELDVSTLEFYPEVRDMCAADKCRAYNKNWVCPPACGTLEECEKRVRAYKKGIIVQSVGELEDEFDFETIEELAKRHSRNFHALVPKLHAIFGDLLPMSAGECSKCDSCTYPDAPCRFPESATSSMEAYGLFVSKVCELNGMKYYYGKNTLAYTSCILLKTEQETDQ